MTWRAIQDTVAFSESLAALSSTAERLYWRIVAQTDGHGRLPGAPTKVRAKCCPLLVLSDSDIAAALDELVRAERIEHYCIDGDWFIQVIDFEKNQPRDLLRKRGDSKFPPAPEHIPGLSGPGAGQTESKRRVEKSSSKRLLDTPGAAANESSNGQSQGEPEPVRNGRATRPTWTTVASSLRDADERTASVIAAIAKNERLPEAALHNAVEALETRRRKPGKPLDSEAKYFVATLKRLSESRQYS